MIKILHTADVHLDGAFRFLGEQGTAHRRRIQTTFDQIVDLAAKGGYHLLLIAGDLFDDMRPAQAAVEHVKRKLGSLSIPVCILPGNHDPYHRRSLYHRERFPSNVYLLKDTPTYLDFPELDLTIAGTPGTEDVSQSALHGLQRRPGRRWFVVLAHGNLQIPNFAESNSRPLRPAELAALGADYVALGDWHGWMDCSSGGVKAFYCGAPEPTDRNQSATGQVLSVILSDAGVSVEKVRVGYVEARTHTIDVTNLDETAIVEQIRRFASPSQMLTIQLTGMKAVDHFISTDAIHAAVVGGCYSLRLMDEATPMLANLSAADFPESQVIGQFVRLLAAEIEQATDPQKKRTAEQALQLGVALLQGKDVLQ